MVATMGPAPGLVGVSSTLRGGWLPPVRGWPHRAGPGPPTVGPSAGCQAAGVLLIHSYGSR